MNKQTFDKTHIFFHQGNKIPTCLISAYTHFKNYSKQNKLYLRVVQFIPESEF